MRLQSCLAAFSLLLCGFTAAAESVTYNFDFVGHWVAYVPTVASATGYGSITFSKGPLLFDNTYRAGVTDFALTTTVDVPGVGSSSYTFDEADMRDPLNGPANYWTESATGELALQYYLATDLETGTNPSLQAAAILITGSESQALISIDAADNFNGGVRYYVQSDPTPLSSTPEPSSLLLLGSGLFGIFCLRRVWSAS